MPLLLLPMSRAERRKRIEIALAAVDLLDRAEHYPRQMSGGQEQRAGIARAIVANPKVVVADEPTGDLDPVTSEQILGLLKRLNRELDTTLLMVKVSLFASLLIQIFIESMIIKLSKKYWLKIVSLKQNKLF